MNRWFQCIFGLLELLLGFYGFSINTSIYIDGMNTGPR